MGVSAVSLRTDESIYIGSATGPDKPILKTCFGEFIADDSSQTRDLRIYPASNQDISPKRDAQSGPLSIVFRPFQRKLNV